MAKDLNNILLSQIEENKIKEKTPDKLPLNPTAEGWSGHEVRRFLAKSLIDSEGSFLAEFKKKMIEIKAQFEDVFGEGDGDIQGQIDILVQKIDSIGLDEIFSLEQTVLNNYNTLNDLKVDKTLTILDIDLQDNITLSEFKTALGEATTLVNGLMSALDKENLEQTMIDIQSLFSDLGVTDQNVADLQTNKVPKTTTIIGLDLEDNILLGEFRTALGNATQSVAGLLSAEDKTHLDGLVALLETDDENKIVDTIGEILNIFQEYPEGADLVAALQGKVDKVEGKGLSTNDFTDDYKDKVDNQLTIGNLETQAGRGDYVETAYNHSQATHAPIDAQKNSDITKTEIEAKLIGEITSHSHALPSHNHDTDYYKKSEAYSKPEIDQIENDIIDYIDSSDSLLGGRIDNVDNNVIGIGNNVLQLQTGKQDKLVPGDNITIDPNTNVISSSGIEFVISDEAPDKSNSIWLDTNPDLDIITTKLIYVPDYTPESIPVFMVEDEGGVVEDLVLPDEFVIPEGDPEPIDTDNLEDEPVVVGLIIPEGEPEPIEIEPIEIEPIVENFIIPEGEPEPLDINSGLVIPEKEPEKLEE